MLPIVFVQLADLRALDIPKSSIKFSTLSLGAGAADAVTVAGPDAMHIVLDLGASPPTVRKWASIVDGAQFHSETQDMALAKGCVLQVYAMAARSKLAQTRLPDPPSFMRWLAPGVLGIIVAGTLLVWNVHEDGSAPQVEVELDPLLGGDVQITSLKASPSLKYYCIGGLAVVDGHINGVAQLYAVDTGVSVPLQAHAVDFAPSRTDPDVELIVIADRPAGHAAGTLSLLPLPLGEHTHLGGSGPITFFSHTDNDFPVAVWASPSHGIIYTISKFGLLFINELGSGQVVYSNRISDTTIFVSGINPDGAFVGVNVAGQVLLVDLNFDTLHDHITYVLNNPGLADVFAPIIAHHKATATDALADADADATDAHADASTDPQADASTDPQADASTEPQADNSLTAALNALLALPPSTSLDDACDSLISYPSEISDDDALWARLVAAQTPTPGTDWLIVLAALKGASPVHATATAAALLALHPVLAADTEFVDDLTAIFGPSLSVSSAPLIARIAKLISLAAP